MQPIDAAKEEAKAPKYLLPSVITELAGSGDIGITLSGMLRSLACERCGICQGVGHNAKGCPVIKQMNKMTKESRVLKKVWGTYKGTKRSGGR